mgnify:CR=1 FL=1
MRLIFAGTPEFAATAMRGLQHQGHDIALVLTQPDRPAGRGMKLMASPVKQLAQQLGLPVLQPLTLKDSAIQAQLAAVNAQIMVVVAYGLILPEAVLNLPALGAINIHASLLPRWRGAAPIQRAILAGDSQSGVCIMQMEPGLDTGPVLLSRATAITEQDSAATLHDRLAALGSELIVELLKKLETMDPDARKLALRAAAQPQPVDGVTYAAKIHKAEAQINWCTASIEVLRQIHAFNPAPGAYSLLLGETVKVWEAKPGSRTIPAIAAGTILHCNEEGIEVATNDGTVLLLTLQRPGARRLTAAEFLRGQTISPGMSFAALPQPDGSAGTADER